MSIQDEAGKRRKLDQILQKNKLLRSFRNSWKIEKLAVTELIGDAANDDKLPWKGQKFHEINPRILRTWILRQSYLE